MFKKIILILLILSLFSSAVFAKNNLKKNIFLYQVSDYLLNEIYNDEIQKYPEEIIEKIVYSDEFKSILVLNVFYYMKLNNIKDSYDFYFRKDRLDTVKVIMKAYIFDEISMIVNK